MRVLNAETIDTDGRATSQIDLLIFLRHNKGGLFGGRIIVVYLYRFDFSKSEKDAALTHFPERTGPGLDAQEWVCFPQKKAKPSVRPSSLP